MIIAATWKALCSRATCATVLARLAFGSVPFRSFPFPVFEPASPSPLSFSPRSFGSFRATLSMTRVARKYFSEQVFRDVELSTARRESAPLCDNSPGNNREQRIREHLRHAAARNPAFFSSPEKNQPRVTNNLRILRLKTPTFDFFSSTLEGIRRLIFYVYHLYCNHAENYRSSPLYERDVS